MISTFVVLIFAALFASFLNAADPPTTWKEHCFDHNQTLTRKYFNSQVAIYFDGNVVSNITWVNTYFTNAWSYVKSVYGDFGGDNRLYAIFHTNRYGGGHPHTTFDQEGDYRSVIDCGKDGNNAWTTGTGNDLDMPTHEIAHIVEGAAHGVHESPAFDIWGDSKWAEIFNYDVYLGLGKTSEAQRWYNDMINGTDSFPRAGTQWFKNWFYPIYTMNGASMGSWTLNKFFLLLSENFPQNGNSYSRKMNMGEFVHFWSGAVGSNLKSLATTAFGWPSNYETQFNQAKIDFPNLPYDKLFKFYDLTNQQGQLNYQNLIGQCSNGLLDSGFNDRASSIDTNGMCVRVFDDIDCEGDSKVFSDDPRNECTHADFSQCGLNNKATSFNNC